MWKQLYGALHEIPPHLLPFMQYLGPTDYFSLIASGAVPTYPYTDAEMRLWGEHAEKIAQLITHNNSCTIVEYGPGKGQNTTILLLHLVAQGAQVTYHGLDLSSKALLAFEQSIHQLARQARIDLRAEDYSQGHGHIGLSGPVVLLFAGGNICNYDTVEMLSSLCAKVQPGDKLVVTYHAKMADRERLLAAYNDPITAEFVLNAFRQLNDLCGAEIDLDALCYTPRVNSAGHVIMEVCPKYTIPFRVPSMDVNYSWTYGVPMQVSFSHKISPAEWEWAVAKVQVEGKRLCQRASFTTTEDLVTLSVLEVI